MKSSTKRYFGAHVSVAGGLENSLSAARTLGINTIQVHPSPPQRWNTKPFASGVEDLFLRALPESGVERIFFHAIYLINLANPDAQKFRLSQLSLIHDLDLCHRIGGHGVIVHVGSLKDQPDTAIGMRQVAEGINCVLDEYRGAAPLLLEVAAGSGSVIGDRLEELAEIVAMLNDRSRVGFCLDSQHMWASGYDMRDGTEAVINEVDAVFGLDNVRCFHLNDSKVDRASNVDRHENLGDGKIGEQAIRTLVTHPKLQHIPFVLETPGLKDLDTAGAEVEKLRRFIEGRRE